MAQARLSQGVAAAATLALGAAVEVAAPQSAALTAADYAVGAALGCGSALLLPRRRTPALLGLLCAVAWYAGTLSGASSAWPHDVGAALIVLHRAPLLGLLLLVAAPRIATRTAWVPAAAGCGATLLPLAVSGPITVALAGAIALLAVASVGSAAADRRPLLAMVAGVSALLAAVWALAAWGSWSGSALLALNDAGVAAAGIVALTAAAGWWTRAAERTVAIALSQSRHPGLLVTQRLSRALADPDLEARYALPGVGWVDEQGRPQAEPGTDGRRVTRVSAPAGREVALVHGADAAPDARLARAAAAAAALALDTARVDAETRAHAAEIQAARLRLLGVADAERQALEQRLSDGVLTRLRAVQRLLAGEGEAFAAERSELGEATDELLALARGLYPPALDRSDLAGALAELAARAPTPTAVAVRGDLGALPESHRAAVWFLCSEGLANVARHAQATQAAITVERADGRVRLEIRDDGRGGATPTRGLRGFADRVDALGGVFALSSPPGGPTVLSVALPIDAPTAEREAERPR